MRDSAKLLKREREQRSWSQEDVAEKIGTTTTNVSRWERDINLPGPYFRQKLCELFGKSAEELGFVQEDEASSSVPQVRLPLWNVPYRRNPFFTGREEVLQRLHQVLDRKEVAALTQSYALSGLGGVGKTQTAVEYAYRHQNKYHAVLWTGADSYETLVSDFVCLADLLNLPEKNEQDQNLAVEAVKRWLNNHRDWLLIVDNVENLEMLERVLPSARQGHILLTTRLQALGVIAQGIEMQKMAPEEGALFLLRRAKLLALDDSPDHIAPIDYDQAKAISEVMDGLPLALDQAGAYIEETQCSLSGYLDLFRAQRRVLLKERGTPDVDHPASVVTTFSLSFEKVQRADPVTAELLRLCAFLAPDEIPEEIITDGASYLGSTLQSVAGNQFMLNAAYKELLKYSLIHRNPRTKTLSIHRLVQAVLKDSMSEETYRQWVERTVQAVNQAFPNVEVAALSRSQRYLPHALACAVLIEQHTLTLPEAARLLDQTGYHLEECAQFTLVEPFYQRALAIREKVLGPEHPHTAASLYSLARLYRNQGKYKEAEPLSHRALAIREKVLGPEHPDTATSFDTLARLYRELGKYKEAEPLSYRALAIREKVLGPEHRRTATSLHELARLYRELGRYKEAEPPCQRALAIYEKVLGPEHPYTAASLNTLAGLYQELGKYEEAEPLYQRAVAIREKVLGPEHPYTALSLHSLADLYRVQGKCEDAKLFCQRALAIYENALGPEHPYIAICFNILADLCKVQGKYEEAESLYQRALAIYENTLGAEHSDTATSLNNLANLYQELGKHEEAESLYQRALAIRKGVLGAEHPNTIATLENYASLLRETNREDEAAALETRVEVSLENPR